MIMSGQTIFTLFQLNYTSANKQRCNTGQPTDSNTYRCGRSPQGSANNKRRLVTAQFIYHSIWSLLIQLWDIQEKSFNVAMLSILDWLVGAVYHLDHLLLSSSVSKEEYDDGKSERRFCRFYKTLVNVLGTLTNHIHKVFEFFYFYCDSDQSRSFFVRHY